jgi:hypothetical protein
MLTSPKLMLPFQIARAIQTYFAPRAENARPTVVISSKVSRYSRIPANSAKRAQK